MDVFTPDFDLKRSLAQDASGAVLKAVCDALREGGQTLRRTMDQGLAPADFQTATALKNAFTLAEESIVEYWKLKHPAA